MYFSLISIIVLLLVIFITSLQNSIPLNMKFMAWEIQITFTALVLYASMIGAVIMAILILPKLVKKTLQLRSLNREINKLKKEMTDAGKENLIKMN